MLQKIKAITKKKALMLRSLCQENQVLINWLLQEKQNLALAIKKV